MMGTIAPSAAPAHAIRCWVDANSLYFELPSLNAPCVLAFPRSADGFQRALAVLFVRHEVEGHGEAYTRPLAPLNSPPNRDGVTEAQRREAWDLLKRSKIIP